MNGIKTHRVYIVIPCLLPGGTEMQTLCLVRALLGAGMDVTVVCYYEHDEGIVASFRDAGSYVSLMKKSRGERLGSLLIKLIRLLKSEKPDIVHVQYMAPGLIPILAAKLAGVNTVFATVHQPGRTYGWKAKLLIRLAAKMTTAFTAVSMATEESWFGSNSLFNPDKPERRGKHFTVYNSVDVVEIDSSIRDIDKEILKSNLGVSGKKVIGVAGRLRSEKGQRYAIEAMKPVSEVNQEAVMIVIGNGPDEEMLKELSESLGLGEKIVFVLPKGRKEFLSFYAIMDICVVPSLFEGFGLVAAEAMAARVPVVASDVDGLKEVLGDENGGLLFRSGCSQSLAEKIDKLLSNPANATIVGKLGRKRVEERFSTTKFNENTLSYYKTYSQGH